MEKVTIKKDSLDFLFYSYFGITPKETAEQNDEEIAACCAHRAYLDLNRTLTYHDRLKEKDGKGNVHRNKEIRKIKMDFVNDICKLILKEIINTMFDSVGQEDFDKKHEALCEKIIKEATSRKLENSKETILILRSKEEKEVFTYGQAQKWLNMTMKYMWLVGLWDNDFEKIHPFMHVPVDSYIMEAASSEDVAIPRKENNSESEYSESLSSPWSKWNYNEYSNFQKKLREKLGAMFPIDWEGPAWIKIAQKRKMAEVKK